MPIVTLPNFLVALISSPFVVFLCQWLKQEHWSTEVKTGLLLLVSAIVAAITLVVEYHAGITSVTTAIALFSSRGLELFALAQMLYAILAGKVGVIAPPATAAAPPPLWSTSQNTGAPAAQLSPGTPPSPPPTKPSA